MIDVTGLGVRFAGFDAVRDVSFRIGSGESYGLVGESGSGKSTILRVLAGLNAQWTGSVTINGAPLVPPARLRGAARRDFFRRVQMVFQDPYGSLHPRQTIDRILAEPLLVHGIDGIDARIIRALDEVALPASLRFRFPHQLSGGQRQRVAIARALIAGPEVLLLDEPTSALDVSMQAGVLNLLADLRAARRLTCVLVTHNLAVVAHLCERIAVMQAGALVEEVGVEALRAGEVRHPHTEELWRLTMALEEVG